MTLVMESTPPFDWVNTPYPGFPATDIPGSFLKSQQMCEAMRGLKNRAVAVDVEDADLFLGTQSGESWLAYDYNGDEAYDMGTFPQDDSRKGSRDSIREEIKATIEKNVLHGEINDMLSGIQTRQMDAVMEQISDAQIGKILTDARGYRVRVEQYVLRPDSQTVQLINVCLRTAPNLQGLHILDWTTKFNNSLDSLASTRIRDLPWNNYLDSYENFIDSPDKFADDTSIDVWPEEMSIELKHNSHFLKEMTVFTDRVEATQDIDSKVLYYDLPFTNSPSGSEDIKNKLGSVIMQGGRGDGYSPTGFYYNLDNDHKIYLYPYVIGDSTSGEQTEYYSLAFNTLGDILRTNMGGTSNDIGTNNLEIELIAKEQLEDTWWTSDPIIDIIYVPFLRMDWKEEGTLEE